MITTDEEIGGYAGAKPLLDKKEYSPQFFLSGEGQQKQHIITKAKGMIRLHIISLGNPTHSSRPWLGDNAIWKLIDAIRDIQKLFPIHEDDIHWHSTATLSQISGGEAINSVPKHALANFDIRFTEEWENGDTITNAIKKVLKNHPGVRVEPTEINDPMLLIPHTNHHLQKLASAFQKHTPRVTEPFGVSHGTSDARFASWKGIPAVEYGPMGHHAHHDEEHIEIAELERYYNVCRDFIYSL